MSASAIIMMLVAIVTVWGGMAVSIVHLMRHPEEHDDE
ncbi:methionine/alanine import family NSS transporter small subunit [Paramicrobacterium agarici]|uniref:Putative methionine/alanine importer small subunit n=1 Tax=Paramicrobacterium agarici TaxID=630514 RepID=A0A2A9DZB2_9MICO|nr:methionine/alanine import family NSS transporter small subunit [Microbacterium agarici]PFG32028.1 putative methionine/alanine importer small subunit [Microbacterium agarici]TQO21918.1 putative methionine/alanine importer small subunit [Microbacterium agarici]